MCSSCMSGVLFPCRLRCRPLDPTLIPPKAVPTTSGLRTCAEVDKAGVRIAGCEGAAYVAGPQSRRGQG